MKRPDKLWQLHRWYQRLTAWELIVIWLLLVILGSIWLIFDHVHHLL